jgi:hypothetical protein
MTTSSVISEKLRRQSVVPIESTIPPEMTIEQWRRRRSWFPTRLVQSAEARHGLGLRDAA